MRRARRLLPWLLMTGLGLATARAGEPRVAAPATPLAAALPGASQAGRASRIRDAAAAAAAISAASLREQVIETERGFARTMADRDPAAFARYLADEALFFSGPGDVLRGKDAVAAAWKHFFEAPAAPFSWEPDEVEVLQSGTLALSSGPVRDPSGRVSGRFNSIWRREPDGRWRIVFDKGERPCRCPEPPR